jgi:hypothetical protein
MAEFQNFRICEQLGQFESRPKIPDNRYRLVIDFPEIDLNTPTVWMLGEHRFCTCIVDSFVPNHDMGQLSRALVLWGQKHAPVEASCP